MKTTLVAAITRYTCSLACLESFSRDAGLFFTQADLLKYHPAILLDPNKSEQYGAIDLGRLLALCQALALNPQAQRNFDFAQLQPVLQSLRSEQTVLFFILDFLKNGNCHTVRFDSFISGTTLRIMNLTTLKELRHRHRRLQPASGLISFSNAFPSVATPLSRQRWAEGCNPFGIF